DTAFTWGADRAPRIPWHESVIYEVHVKGFTMRHPEVPSKLRGSYAGLSTATVIEHLKRLGITAVELMPVHYFTDDRHLLDKGLRNYWGYNSIGYFAPERRYGVLDPISEFKTMVKTMHSAGIEVVLMWFTTTPPKATTWAQHFPFAVLITPPTTACSPTIRAITWITPARATALTGSIH